MHEMSIAANLVEKLLEFAYAHPERKVMLVRLAVGELTHLEPEQLRFCYGAITAETPLEGSSLEIEKVAATVQCPHCAYCGRPQYWEGILAQTSVVTLCCPQCGKAAEAIQGHECAIQSIRYREEAPA